MGRIGGIHCNAEDLYVVILQVSLPGQLAKFFHCLLPFSEYEYAVGNPPPDVRNNKHDVFLAFVHFSLVHSGAFRQSCMPGKNVPIREELGDIRQATPAKGRTGYLRMEEFASSVIGGDIEPRNMRILQQHIIEAEQP